MVKVKRLKAGQYSVSDGRFITKSGAAWYILSSKGNHDFGPVPTLASAKAYVITGTVLPSEHNLKSKHGRRQSKKEFNAYLASEAKNGNYEPVIIWFIIMLIATIFFTFIQGL